MAKKRLIVANPGNCPKEFPVLEYADGLKFYEGAIWKRPLRTTLEIEQKLIGKGYLVEVGNG